MNKSFTEVLKNKNFIVTCELAPPKGTKASELVKHARSIKGLVDAINITDGQGGNMRMSSVIASYLVQKKTGINTICQLVCRDRNSIGLQSDILGAIALEITSFLCLTGDKAAGGDNPKAKDVFELSTDSMLDLFKNFEGGKDLAENKLDAPVSNLVIGTAAHPGMPDLKDHVEKIRIRVEEKGVKFLQSQICFEPDQIKRFLELLDKAKIKIPVLIGIMPLKGIKMAKFIDEKVFGVSVPKNIFERLENAVDPRKEGTKIAIELAQCVKEYGGRGVHIMAVGQEEKLPALLSTI